MQKQTASISAPINQTQNLTPNYPMNRQNQPQTNSNQNSLQKEAEDAFVNYFLNKIGPTQESERKRVKIFEQVKFLIEKALGGKSQVMVIRYGSDPLKTYLPDSDIDITVIRRDYLQGNQTNQLTALTQLKLIKKEIEIFGETQNGKNFVKSMVLIDQADVEIIKLNFQNTFVDISIKQVGGICTLYFMNYMAKRIGKQQLLKKSIILLKAWFTYDASILGSQAACMATYALYVMVLFILNNFYDELNSPMDVIMMFFKVWSHFDWENNIVTIFGPIKSSGFYERLKECQFDIDRLTMLDRSLHQEYQYRKLLVTPDELSFLNLQFSGVRLSDVSSYNLANKKSFNTKYFNIIDPTFSKNNLGKSISKLNSSRIKQVLRLQNMKMRQIFFGFQANDIKSYVMNFFNMFKFTFETCGIHPQVAFMLPQIRVPANIPFKNQTQALPQDMQKIYNYGIDHNQFEQHPWLAPDLQNYQEQSVVLNPAFNLQFNQSMIQTDRTPSSQQTAQQTPNPNITSYESYIGCSAQKNLNQQFFNLKANDQKNFSPNQVSGDTRNLQEKLEIQSQNLIDQSVSLNGTALVDFDSLKINEVSQISSEDQIQESPEKQFQVCQVQNSQSPQSILSSDLQDQSAATIVTSQTQTPEKSKSNQQIPKQQEVQSLQTLKAQKPPQNQYMPSQIYIQINKFAKEYCQQQLDLLHQQSTVQVSKQFEEDCNFKLAMIERTNTQYSSSPCKNGQNIGNQSCEYDWSVLISSKYIYDENVSTCLYQEICQQLGFFSTSQTQQHQTLQFQQILNQQRLMQQQQQLPHAQQNLSNELMINSQLNVTQEQAQKVKVKELLNHLEKLCTVSEQTKFNYK